MYGGQTGNGGLRLQINANFLKISPGFKGLDPAQVLQILSSWPSLERIHTSLRQSTFYEIGVAFCDIYSEEANVLSEKDEEYLKAVNIVPIRPTINCHKGSERCELLVRIASYRDAK